MKFTASAVVVCALMMLGTGCGAPPKPPEPTAATKPTAATPTVASEIDPRWMSLGRGDGSDFQILSRMITPTYQQFSVRPRDDTDEFSKDYNGCGCGPATTALLTVYVPGAFDPTEARSRQTVSVNGGEGYFRPPDDKQMTTLFWSYAPNAWATIDGFSVTMKTLDRLRELAGLIRPSERTPARLPFGLARLPASMPLSSIKTQSGQFPTLADFRACGHRADGLPSKDCFEVGSALNVEVWPSDDFPEHDEGIDGRREVYNVPVSIGGRQGYRHERRNAAAVKVAPGMVVIFSLEGSSRPTNARLDDVLAGVTWAPNPADDATWPAVTEWAG